MTILRCSTRAVIVCLVSLGWLPTADAISIDITDASGRSTVTVDNRSGIASDWSFRGADHLFALSFGFSVNGGPVKNLSDLDLTATIFTDNEILLSYIDPDGAFTVALGYDLSSPFGTRSILRENILIENISSSAFGLSVTLVADFDLSGTFNDDTLERLGGLSATRTSQEDSGAALDGFIDGAFAGSMSLLNTTLLLEDGNIMPAADTVMGDVSWAWTWSTELDPGVAYRSNLRYVLDVPEPSTLALIIIGLSAMAIILRRRSAGDYCRVGLRERKST